MTEDSMTAPGRVALVTGGASGIGLATARRLAGSGDRVVIVDRRADAGEQARDALRAEGLDVTFAAADVTVEEDVVRVVRSAEEQVGPVGVLVNNAGIFEPVRFVEAPTPVWHRTFDVLVKGAYLFSREVAARMVARGTGGVIVNVSSINGNRGLAESSHYNAGKGAVDQLTRCLALELADHGIRVNAVAPGFVDTPMSVVDGENELESEEFQAVYVRGGRIPMRRAGTAEEVAEVVAFLASPAAAYVCGAIVPVDGGLAVTF